MRTDFENAVKIKDLNDETRKRISSFGADVSVFSDFYILPGFIDVHVHLREPGFLYKETVKTGTAAAAAGGFTDIFSMPNLKPCPDCMENLKVQLDAIKKDAAVNVYPYGSITRGEKGTEAAAYDEIKDYVIAFTDDGMGVADGNLMENAMRWAAENNKIIVAHCEDENYPKASSESEWMQLKRDLELVRKTGCSYHACHLSCEESVELVRKAKREGLDVTCETAPHYLTLSDDEISDSGRFKMNPPIKSRADRVALIEAVKDGTVDMIATDHAPHSAEEKSKGFQNSAFGIVGLETAFPVLYSRLVLPGIISLDHLIRMLYDAPGKRFGLPVKKVTEELCLEKPTFTIWNLDDEYEINPSDFMTKGRSTPFEGWHVKGKCMMTVAGGNVVWKADYRK